MPDPTPFMQEALAEARKGVGLTRPNPPVGAVVVKGGVVVGRGFHPRAGEPHAEVFALRAAGKKAKGADLFVTLEPCSTTGRTPPCVEAVIRAGIKRVFVGTTDPNPKHAGAGLRLLAGAGIEVHAGLLGPACEDILRPFAHWITTGKPLVTVKLGLTLDGRIADAAGRSQWITGEAARAEVQDLRRTADALWVGAETLRADNPGLRPRPDEGRAPLRIVLDTAGRLPATLRVFTDEHAADTLVFLGPKAKARAKALAAAGVRVHPLRAGTREEQVAEVIDACGKLGLLHVLCEGGGHLAGSLVAQGLAQDLALFYKPSLLGPAGRPGFVLPALSLDQRLRFHLHAVRPVGDDLRLDLRRTAGSAAGPMTPEAYADLMRWSLRSMTDF